MEPLVESLDAKSERYHAFDNLRGVMLMLLLVLHAAISYMVSPLDAAWPFKDGSAHVGFDLIGAFIHMFRLPLFFVMAGFFGALLYYQRGARKFIRNRFQRIAIPLVVFWVLLAPLILAPFAIHFFDGGVRTPQELLSWLIRPEVRRHIHFFHLWFLFDLLIYYAAITGFIQLSKSVGLSARWRGDRIGPRLFASRWGLAPFAFMTAVSLLPTKMGMLESPATFARPPQTLLANAIFVWFGWALYRHRESAARLVSGAWIFVIFGFVCFIGHMACVLQLLDSNAYFRIPSLLFASVSIWLFVYGLIGLSLRYAGKPNRVMRYIADASYWCYLVHLPLIAWLSILMAGWRINVLVKFTIVLVTTVLICLLTYDRFVRSTAIGELINGRRRPRWKAWETT